MARDGIKCSDCGRDLRAFQVIRIKGAPFCTTCFRALSVPGCGRSILVSRSWDAMAGVFIAGSVPSLVVKRSHEIALLHGRLARNLSFYVTCRSESGNLGTQQRCQLATRMFVRGRIWKVTILHGPRCNRVGDFLTIEALHETLFRHGAAGIEQASIGKLDGRMLGTPARIQCSVPPRTRSHPRYAFALRASDLVCPEGSDQSLFFLLALPTSAATACYPASSLTRRRVTLRRVRNSCELVGQTCSARDQ